MVGLRLSQDETPLMMNAAAHTDEEAMRQKGCVLTTAARRARGDRERTRGVCATFPHTRS
jgi:hypothetical protein